MFVSRSTFTVVILTICVLLVISNVAEAAYRKPPFNGSIFGKRSGNSIGSEHTLLSILDKNFVCESWIIHI